MVLPALAVAADAVMRRWRLLVPVVVVVLLIGIPGNVNVLVDYMDTPIVKNQERYRHMMLSLPRVPVAKQVPRDVVPEQQLAHFVTIGWLLDGVASGRIPKPAHISAADEAMDALRLSFRQLRFDQALAVRRLPAPHEVMGVPSRQEPARNHGHGERNRPTHARLGRHR